MSAFIGQVYEERGGLLLPVSESQPAVQEESLADIDAWYYEQHAVCPRCKKSDYETTCLGHIFFSRESARDSNHINCVCGWKGERHEFVPADQSSSLESNKESLDGSDQAARVDA